MRQSIQGAAAVLVIALLAGADVHAQTSAALNTYRPAEHPEDGFLLSGGRPSPHMSLAAQLHLDYANDPLVYEDVAGDADSELVSLVGHQLTSHLAASLGLHDVAMLYIGWQLHVVMLGDALGNQPTATGFGSGDMLFGGRIGVYRSSRAAAALQLTVTAPTGEDGEGRPGVAGDDGATVEPEVTADFAAGPLKILIDVGARWRKDAHFSGARFTDLLTFGAGAALPLVPDLLRAHLELQGASPLDDLGERSTSPLQALLGVKLTPRGEWTFGLAGSAGLLRGYGSPDARAVFTLGHGARLQSGEAPEPDDQPEPDGAFESELPEEPAITFEDNARKPTGGSPDGGTLELADADKDTVRDLDDRCPLLPGRIDDDGCPRFLRFDEQTGAIQLLQPIRFEDDSAELQARSDQLLDEVAATLLARPTTRLRIEGHVIKRRRRDDADARSVQRAVAVASALIARGVDVHRLEGLGCGESRPLVPARSAQSYKNERIELFVVDPLPPVGMPATQGCVQARLPDPPAKQVEGEPAPSAVPVPPPPAPKPTPQPPAARPAPSAPPPPPAPKPTAQPAPLPAPKPAAQPAPLPLPAPKPAALPLPAPKPAAQAPVPPPPAPKPAVPPTAAAQPAPAAPAAKPGAGTTALPAVATTATAAQVLAALANDPDGDRDRDGARNAKDECPLAPGNNAGAGCPEGHRVDLAAGRIELLKPIRFEEGTAQLDARGKKQLDEIAATLRANPEMKIAITADVAADAGSEPSLALTRKRASAVRRELTGRGVAPSRIHPYGCGEDRPIAPNNVPWGRKKNERVELLLLDPAPASSVHSLEGCSAAE